MTHHHRHHRHELAAISHDLDELEALVLLAELERDVAALEAAAGRNVPGATQPLSKIEWDAGIRFGDIDARTKLLAERALAATDRLAEQTVTAMEAALADAGSPFEVRALTSAWASPLAPGLPAGITRAEIEQAARDVEAVLAQAWDDGAADVRAEYEYQGATGLPDTGPAMPPPVLLSLAGAAAAVVTHRVTRALGAAADAARESGATTAPVVAREAVEAARDVSVAGTRDLARQGVHQATSAARVSQIAAPDMPAYKEIYSSETLDGNTCDPCAAVAGTRYPSLQDGLVDYRGSEGGGFRRCLGGLRCRGLLFGVLASESEPTLQTPGDVPPPGPPGPPPPSGPSAPPTSDGPQRAMPIDRTDRIDAAPRRSERRSRGAIPKTYEQALERTALGGPDDSARNAFEWLARRGVDVDPVLEDALTKWPDGVIHASRSTVEAKRLTQGTRNAFITRIREARSQSPNIIVDATEVGLSPQDARAWTTDVITEYGHRIEQIIVILPGRGVLPVEWFRG